MLYFAGSAGSSETNEKFCQFLVDFVKGICCLQVVSRSSWYAFQFAKWKTLQAFLVVLSLTLQ